MKKGSVALHQSFKKPLLPERRSSREEWLRVSYRAGQDRGRLLLHTHLPLLSSFPSTSL